MVLKTSPHKKVFVLLFIIWFALSTIFFVKFSNSIFTLSTLKDNYMSFATKRYINSDYEKQAYDLYLEKIDYYANSNDEIISSFYSLSKLNRSIIILFALIPYLYLISLFVIAIQKFYKRRLKIIYNMQNTI